MSHDAQQRPCYGDLMFNGCGNQQVTRSGEDETQQESRYHSPGMTSPMTFVGQYAKRDEAH